MYNKVKKGMSMLFVACIVSSNFYTAPLLSFAQETQEDLSGQQSILSEQAPDGQEIVKQEMLAGQGNEKNEEGKEPVTEPEGIGAFLSDLMKALRHTILGGEKASQIKDRIIFEDIKLEQDGLDEHKKWAIKILLSSDAAGEGIYQIRELIQKIEIDDLDYPLFSTRGGTKGKRNFVAFEGSLRFYEDNEDGKAGLADFRQREEHKVVITFVDGSKLEKIEEGYVAPDRSGADPFGRDVVVPEEPDVSGPGVADEYQITDVSFEYGDSLYIQFNGKELEKKEGDALVAKMKSIEINGKLFDPMPVTTRFNWSTGKIIIDDNSEINKAVALNPSIKVKLIFNDESFLRYGKQEPNEPIVTTKTAKGYLLTKNKEKTSMADKALIRDIVFTKTDVSIMSSPLHQMKISFKELEVGNVSARVKSFAVVVPEMNNREFPATPVVGEEGSFTVDLPEFYLGGFTTDVPLNVKFTVSPEIPGHQGSLEAILMLDWDNNFIPPEEEAPTPPPVQGPEQGKYKITELKLEKVGEKQALAFKLDKILEGSDEKQIKSVKVNGKVLSSILENSNAINWRFKKHSEEKKYYSDDAEVIAFAGNKTPIEFEIEFKNGTLIKYESTPKLAEEYSIEQLRLEDGYLTTSPKRFIIKLNKTVLTSPQLRTKVESIKVNGRSFTLAESDLFNTREGEFYSEKPEVVEAVLNNLKNARVEILFNDQSIMEFTGAVKDNRTKPVLTEGEYTLKYKAYKTNTGQSEESSISGYLDGRVKLVVKGNKKTITFLNHTHVGLLADIAIKKDGNYVSLNPAKNALNEKYKEYSIELDDLEGVFEGAVLVLMGGKTENDKGKYEKYTTFDLVFDPSPVKGWSNFEKIENDLLNEQDADKILQDVLIKAGVEPDEKGKITPEILREYSGETLSKEEFEGFPMKGVLVLDASRNPDVAKITDISLLKHLGPKIKGIIIVGAKIKSLPEDLFQNTEGLTHAILSGNMIENIPASAFSGAKALKCIDLGGNELTALPEGVFEANKKLETIYLAENKLSTLPNDLISGMSKLKDLYLFGNQLTVLGDNFFDGNSSLKEVNLSKNKLTSLPSSMGELKKLQILKAYHNQIVSVPETFGKFRAISIVDLDFNRIQKAPEALILQMMKLSKASGGHTSLSLQGNNITELPVQEMLNSIEQGEGAKIKYFNVSSNLLKADLTEEEIGNLEKAGINVQTGRYLYHPQKTGIDASIAASLGKIKLNQKFDILEFYYWQYVNSSGKKNIQTEQQFLEHLLGPGRVDSGVDTSLPREDAIKAILEKEDIEWKIETTITKNDQILYSNLSDIGAKEGLAQEFVDNEMKKGDEYTLLKRLYIKNKVSGEFASFIEYTASATADNSNVQPPVSEEKTIGVGIYKDEEGKQPSMANGAINPKARISEKDGKFIYTVEFKALQFGTITGRITKLAIEAPQKKYLDEVVLENSDYEVSYTFELPEKMDSVKAYFFVDAMGSEVSGYLRFKYDEQNTPPLPDETRTAKGYFLTEAKTQMSKTDALLKDHREITLTKLSDEAYQAKVKLGKLDMGAMGQFTVNGFKVKIGESFVDATPVQGQEGFFTFTLPAYLVKDAGSVEDTDLVVEFPAMGAHTSASRAVLRLDWNGDFSPITPPPAEGETIKGYLLTADKKKLSLANDALQKVTKKIVNNGSAIEIAELILQLGEVQETSNTAKEKVTGFEIQYRNQWMPAQAVSGSEGAFRFELPSMLLSGEKALELPAKVKTSSFVTDVVLVLDAKGNYTVPSEGGTTPPPAPPSPTEERFNIPVWLRKASGSEPSMANGALVQTAKVVGLNGDYTYSVTFVPMQVKVGENTITGNVTSFFIEHPTSGKTQLFGTGDSSKEYTFTINQKVRELKVYFDVDAMPNAQQTAYLVFNWDGSAAPSGGGGGTIELKIDENQVPLAGAPIDVEKLKEKAEKIVNGQESKKLYSEKILKGITEALAEVKRLQGLPKEEQDQAKLKEAITKLDQVVETARVERIESLLSEGYMSGTPDNKFMPNNKITRAEIAAMLDRLVDEEATKLDNTADIKEGAWYTDSMKKIVSLGYIQRNADGTFTPDKAFTRAEFAFVLAKLKKLPAGTKAIKDVPADHWAAEAIMACAEAGIIVGYQDGTFRPEKEITRAEAVAMMSRAFGISSKVENKKPFVDVPTTHWAYDVIMTSSKNL